MTVGGSIACNRGGHEGQSNSNGKLNESESCREEGIKSRSPLLFLFFFFVFFSSIFGLSDLINCRKHPASGS